jgi:hypothetical protein
MHGKTTPIILVSMKGQVLHELSTNQNLQSRVPKTWQTKKSEVVQGLGTEATYLWTWVTCHDCVPPTLLQGAKGDKKKEQRTWLQLIVGERQDRRGEYIQAGTNKPVM